MTTIPKTSMCKLAVIGGFACGITTFALAQDAVVEDASWVANPDATATAASDATTFFPTLMETQTLPDHPIFRKGPGGTYQGPDARQQVATGIFPYDRQDGSFYSNHADAFAPVNKALGFFTPHDAALWQSHSPQRGSIVADASLPLFTRTFEPDNAHVKLGPFYLDFLWVGAGYLWTDYTSSSNRYKDNGNDAAYIDLAARVYARLTDTIYLSAVSNLIYLPLENKLAARVPFGSGALVNIDFHYQERVGSWDISLHDRFVIRPGLDFYSDWNSGAVDEAGRYYFGYYDRPGRDVFEDDSVWINNKVEGRASTLVGSEDWRFSIVADHTDFWNTFSFEDHRHRDHLGLALSYEGMEVPFSPMLAYDATTYDFDAFYNELTYIMRGRVTENTRLYADVGYLWTEGRDQDLERVTWKLALNQRLSEFISHGAVIGEDAISDDYSPHTLWSDYIQYYIDARLASRVSLRAYAQWEQSEVLEDRHSSRGPRTGNFERDTVGATLTIKPWDYSLLSVSAIYQNDQSRHRDGESWLYRAKYTHQIGSRWTWEIYYQYEDSDLYQERLTEHVAGSGLRRYF